MDNNKIRNYIKKAIDAMNRAYAPYSKFQVGALVIDENNNEYIGANIENGSYGLTNCAERTAIFTAKTCGMTRIKTIVITAETEQPISPCGACRQVISEFSDENTVIILSNTKFDFTIHTINDILPYRFKLEGDNNE